MTRPPSNPADRDPSARPTDRGHVITNTGWRVSGKAVELLSQAAAAGLRVPEENELLFGASFKLGAKRGAKPMTAVMSTLDAALSRTWDDLPSLTSTRALDRTTGRVHAFHWDWEVDGDRRTGELLWRHPHRTIGGVALTTHVVIDEYPGVATLGIQVGVPSGLAGVRGPVGAGQARPAFLSDLTLAANFTFHGHPVGPSLLGENDIDSFVERVLLAETRRYPVALLAPTESGEYLVPPVDLANELMGVAPLFVMDRHATTFRLSDSLGDRRLSAYWGALRIYREGFSCADWSDAHPLLLEDVVADPIMRAEVIGKLSVRSASAVIMPRGVEALRSRTTEPRPPAPASAPTVTQAGRVVPPSEVTAVASVDSGGTSNVATMLSEMMSKLDALTTTVAEIVEHRSAIAGEISQLRTITAIRSAGTSALERRLERLHELLHKLVAPVELPGVSAPTDAPVQEIEEETKAPVLGDVVHQAEVSFADRLLFLESAHRSALESPYEDVDRAAAVLEAMALVAERRRDGLLGKSLREAFRELGIDYRRTIGSATPKRLRQQYLVHGSEGTQYDCEEHIVLGNSYDPRYCLRIYFTSRATNEARFVIGHIGRHFDVTSTT